jgi:hypothetical protein
MKTKQFKNGTGAFSALQALAIVIQTGTRAEIAHAIASAKANPILGKVQARSMLAKLQALAATNEAQYDVFKLNGNGKLPFVAFSSLPGVTCPGAGDCINFCYSYRAWRFAHAFGRMAQNAYLMRFNQAAIVGALQSATEKLIDFDLRLYVDGDFSSAQDVAFWMREIKARPTIRAYGYSKSFSAILQFSQSGGLWAENYKLNISSGHNASAGTVALVKMLPITRGEFIAVPIGRIVKGTEHGTPAVNKALRENFAGKLFPCPGTCGTCTPKGHACGSDRFKNIPIAIAIH